MTSRVLGHLLPGTRESGACREPSPRPQAGCPRRRLAETHRGPAVPAGAWLRLTSAAGLGRRLDDPDVPEPVDLGLRVHRGDFVQQSLALGKVIPGTGDEGLAATKQDPEARQVLRVAAPREGWEAALERAPAHPRAIWERGLQGEGDRLLEDQTAGTPPGAVPGPRQGAGSRKPGSLCWGPPHQGGRCRPAWGSQAARGSGTRAQLSVPWADWLMATSSRQPRGQLRKTPQQGAEAGRRHSVCVGLVLASWTHPPATTRPPRGWTAAKAAGLPPAAPPWQPWRGEGTSWDMQVCVQCCSHPTGERRATGRGK